MYCPKCAAQCSSDQKFCRTCGFELHIVSQIFSEDIQGKESEPGILDSLITADEQIKSWKPLLERTGVISIMLALMIGCIIPISMGINHGIPNIPLILILAGIAGLFLFGGIILVIFAEEPKKSKDRKTSLPKLQRAEQTNKLLPEAQSENFINLSITDRTTDLLPTPESTSSSKTA